MSGTPYTPDDDAAGESDRQANAMKAQLRKDVESWSKARSDSSPGRIAEADAPPIAKPASRPANTPRKSAPAPAQAAKPAAGSRTKPFSMSYDGGSTAEYIQYMIDRGAR